MDINELVKLTDAQKSIVSELWDVYVKAQRNGIAFAINENSNLVAYNSLNIADYDSDRLFSKNYEEVDLEQMHEVFPVWDYDTLCLLRKEQD